MTKKTGTLKQDQDFVKQDTNNQNKTSPESVGGNINTNTNHYNHNDADPQGGSGGEHAKASSYENDPSTNGASVAVDGDTNSLTKATSKVSPYMKDCRKLFVGGLPSNVTEEEFREFFERHGVVIDSVVMVDRDTGRSRGFGFVTFEDPQVANNLVTASDGNENNKKGEGDKELKGRITMRGKVCELKFAQPKEVMARITGGGRAGRSRRSTNYKHGGQPIGQVHPGYVDPNDPIAYPYEPIIFPQVTPQPGMMGPWPISSPYHPQGAPSFDDQQQGNGPIPAMMFPAYVPGMYYPPGAPIPVGGTPYIGYQPASAPPPNAKVSMPLPNAGVSVSESPAPTEEQPPIAQAVHPVPQHQGYTFVPLVMGVPPNHETSTEDQDEQSPGPASQ